MPGVSQDYPHPSRIPAVPQDELPTEVDVLAARVMLKFCLTRTTGMFYSRTSLAEEVWNEVRDAIKTLVKKSSVSPKTRRWLGGSLDVWWDYHTAFAMAVPSLKEQSFFPINSNEVASVTNFMCSNYATLIKDIERVTDLVRLARNMVMVSQQAQTYAAESGFEQKMLQLLEVCIRVCGRAADFDPTGQQEQACSAITSAYKSCLVTCLQYFHNAIHGNENRKLSLWIDLFGFPMDTPLGTSSPSSDPLTKPEDGLHFKSPVTVHDYKPDPEWDPDETFPRLKNIMRALRAVHLVSLKDDEQDRQLASDFTDRSMQLLNDIDESTDRHDAKRPDVLKFFSDILSPDEYKERPTRSSSWLSIEHRMELHKRKKRSLVKDIPVQFPEIEGIPIDYLAQGTPGLENAVRNMTLNKSTPRANDGPPLGLNGQAEEEDEEDEDDEDDEDEDYEDESEPEDDYDPYAASYKQRGLLAEIPLILGPTEIEALPMILQNGIMPPENAAYGAEAYPIEGQVLQALRCNLLVFSEQGRNLIREMLLLISVWDLQEDDMYFKLMTRIISAILADGYLTLAYNGFREHKDIVSPAQQTLVKILTLIFRHKKQEGPPRTTEKDTDEDNVPPYLSRDRVVVYDMVNEFRIHVIPRTLAYIWLQGKIRNHVAIPEDFPLNLWDVERIYEGVYQFVELFASLAETATWKQILVHQDLTFELIELLRALDTSIPKAPLGSLHHPHHAQMHHGDSATSPHQDGPAGPVPVSVERPFDTNVESPTTAAVGSPEGEAPPEMMEASRFEWRNLKKLVILCLSSLIWQSPKVKKRVRDLGGVDLIMACCGIDELNPFIKEHALLCLQFMVDETAEKEMLRAAA
ncbi:MAG: copper transport protein [Stictis urceolatum]|nr:copper transport protein [Stictis urceolata]